MSSIEYLRGEKQIDPKRKRHGLTTLIGRAGFRSKMTGRLKEQLDEVKKKMGAGEDG